MLELTGLNKMEGFGPVYVINMERSIDRKKYIQDHFEKYGVSDYTFVEAIDGSKDDINSLLSTPFNESIISKSETACTISHLKAIEHWLTNSESEYAIIVEDDVSFETVDFWGFTWKNFLDSVTQDYDVLQMAIINNFVVNPRLHLREYLDWSAAVYLIKRRYAQRLIKKHKIDDKYTFSQPIRYKCLSEGAIFSNALCYSIPLFTYSLDHGSSLNESHIETIHKNSKNQVLSFWHKNSMFKPDLM
jgi:GR25 family glycosyltransferase involved in LPS biosynthesis